MKRFLIATAALLSLGVAAHAAESKLKYEDVFADATEVVIPVQVAGTYEERSELLVKLPNDNQYAVPVADPADLAAWRKNDLVNVVITQGIVADVRRGGPAPAFSYTVLDDTEVLDGIPEDTLVRQITVTTTVKDIEEDIDQIVFLAAAGDDRTATVMTPGMLKKAGLKPGDLVDLIYFDEIDIEPR
ncbi:hypothetical protein [Acuticoccus mangrovi]|uniref:Uncharacterized protein n=1 Tax=Acuticoccus mangrovi TaxID=2796142 RepID=A0A934IS25_9HYPH|nr:hypothetical protein [Acuticoccus mangrovi]MBJ3777635.1 hypothetical protein [Acuticoccus mangrovi]